MSFATTAKATALQRAEAYEHRRIAETREQTAGDLVNEKAPLGVRLLLWTHHQVVTPHKIVRFLSWILSPTRWIRARIAVAAILGSRVGKVEYDERQTICAGCLERDGDYCTVCGCPRWWLSRLRFKNRLRGHLCPLASHRGRYPRWKLHFVRQKCKSCGSLGGGNGRVQDHREKAPTDGN